MSVTKFRQLLAEVRKHKSVKAIAVNCLVPSAKVEAWLKGDDLPKRSVIPVLNKALKQMQRSYEQKTATEETQESDEGVA